MCGGWSPSIGFIQPGFDRLASWAAARQARLLAELARRRPTDQAPYSARWAGVGSEYAPDEVGVALRLARGTAVARVGLARRLLATLSDTHAAWEAGLIDTAKVRAIDDATWMLSVEHARAVQERVLPRAAEQIGDEPGGEGEARSSRTGERTEAEPTGGSDNADRTARDDSATGAGRPIHPVTPGKPLIQIVIPYSTLIGADDQPAELVGVGPIPRSPPHSPARPPPMGCGAG